MRFPLLGLFKTKLSFLPKENSFFFLLHQSAMNIGQVARRMQDLLDDFDNVEAKVQEIKDLEDLWRPNHPRHNPFSPPDLCDPD